MTRLLHPRVVAMICAIIQKREKFMSKMKACLAFCLAVLSSVALANDGQVTGVHIIRLQINASLGDFVFIQTDGTPSTPASCSVNGFWQFTLPVTNAFGTQAYAALVAAYAAGTPVMLAGTGSCNEFFSVESLSAFELSPH